MPLVTAIERQKKRSDVFSIFVDDHYAFSLDELILSASPLRVGLELTESDVADWSQRSSLGKAYNAALRYLSYRQRSEHELRQYLRGKDYPDEAIASTLERLRELSLLDDHAFASSWVADRQRLRPRSRLALTAELRQKGVGPEVIEAVLSGLGHGDEVEALRRLIQKKRHRYNDEAKLMAYLGSLGYSYGLIKEAINDET